MAAQEDQALSCRAEAGVLRDLFQYSEAAGLRAGRLLGAAAAWHEGSVQAQSWGDGASDRRARTLTVVLRRLEIRV